ncbi:MAG: hypothetical protein EOP66_01785 [Sphingomonas sp.]|nr:MAG: hypothetical protein EOP66_01785 [Sphingomonas sp.]
MDGTGTGSLAIDALVRLSLAEGNEFDPSSEPGCSEMTLPMSDRVRLAGAEDPALSYVQTIGEKIPREGFVDEAADVLITFPFSTEAMAAAQAEAARGGNWRTGFSAIFAAIGGAAVLKEGLREPPNWIGVGVGLLFLMVAILLFRRRPRAGEDARPD